MAATVPALASEEVLEEVIVTAQFRAENLQETPIAITAISGEELEERAVTSAYEVAYTVPNASFRPAQAAYGNTVTAYIRGVGQYDFDFAFEPGVGVYIDDVYHPFTLGSSIELLDLERVEVLRGPQGTLFGRGSIGGAVRYITRKPEGDGTGSISLTGGRHDRIDLKASYDFGITDNLSARITGVTSSRGGYQDVIDFTCAFPGLAGDIPSAPANRIKGCKTGTQGGEDIFGGRGTLRWASGERAELTVSAEYLKSDAEPRADTVTAILPGPWSPFETPYDERFLPPNPYVTYATYYDPWTGQGFERRTGLEKKTASGRADLQINDQVGAALILAYTDLTASVLSDADGSPINVQQTAGVQDVEFSTAELRFSGRARDRVDWTVGAFLYDGKAISAQTVYIPWIIALGAGSFPTAPIPLVNTYHDHDNRNTSFFGHAVFDLTDRLSLTTGLRYSEDRKQVDFDNTIAQFAQTVKGDRTDWRLGIDYRLTDDALLYASASTGYRPGGYNPRPFQVTQQVAVAQEESTAYELGVKADLFDRRLRLNVAAFYTDWGTRIVPDGGTECLLVPGSDPPEYDTVPEGTEGAVQDDLGNWCMATTSRTFYNNHPGKASGAELEFLWNPAAGLSITGAYGLLGWKSPDIDDDPNVLSSFPAYVPKRNWALGASYDFDLAGGARLTPRLDVYGQSRICSQDVEADNAIPDASCTSGYELMNARIEWSSPERAWSVAVGATNLADKTYYLNKFDLTAFGQPHAEGQPGRPREWYLSFTRNFH